MIYISTIKLTLEGQDIITETHEDIVCFKCKMQIRHSKNNKFVFGVYGNISYIFKCDCGASYLIKVNVKRLIPGR